VIVIGEQAARHLVTPQDAIDAVEEAFREVSRGHARTYPFVREPLSPKPDVYGIKSGADLEMGLLGLKIGGYWTRNRAVGLTNHQSTTVLTNPESGCPTALVSSNYLTGVRTAAACALGIRELARSDTKVLGLIGAGAQSGYHIEAARLVRDFDVVLIADRDADNARDLAAEVNASARAEAADIETVARHADVLITLTPSREPVVKKEWIRPGTHISAMGADTVGKNELEITLVLDASVWVDDWTQASTIGECQHAAHRGLQIRGSLCDLIEGKGAGRTSAGEITVFDSTGLAIQDLIVAARAVKAAESSNVDGVHRIDLGRKSGIGTLQMQSEGKYHPKSGHLG
jgi:ornithine cyclodeaminase/alanine dehydrogenase-like protein (mu-crystallin family)